MPLERRVGRVARALGRAARLACPRCGAGPMFRGWFTMAPACATASLVLGGYLILWRLTGLSTAAQLALWLPVAVLFPLWFFRYSRSLWLALEYALNPEP